MDKPHLPHPSPIDGHGGGGFRFADLSHKGSLLCLPSGLYAWAAKTPADFTEESFAAVIEERDRIDLLIVGTGRGPAPFPKGLRQRFLTLGIALEAMPTGAAAQTWNILIGENRRVAAALIAVA